MNKVVFSSAYGAALLLLAVAVALVNSYDFEDSEFNQLLASDLQDLYSPSMQLHPRSRRDEEAVIMDKCRPRRKRLCCADTVMDQIHDGDKDYKRECFKEVTGKDRDGGPIPRHHERGEFDPFKCDKVDKHRKEMTCVIQCVGQKKNMLDADGNPKEDGYTSFVKESFAKESWSESLQDKVISACLAEAKNATANYDATDSESCNPAGIKLAHCMFREIQLGCPEDQIKDQKACSRLRERIKKHDFFPPPPPLNDEQF